MSSNFRRFGCFGVLVVSSSFRVWCVLGGIFNFSCLVPFWCVGVSSSFVVFDAFLLVCLQVFVVPFGGVRVSSSFVALGAFWCVSVGVSSSFRRVWCLLVCWCVSGSSSFRSVGCLLVLVWCLQVFVVLGAFWCVGVVSSSFRRGVGGVQIFVVFVPFGVLVWCLQVFVVFGAF